MEDLMPDKRKDMYGLLRTSFASNSVYDFQKHKVISSQWRLLQSLGYGQEDFDNVSRFFFKNIIHPNDVGIIERHIIKIRESKSDEVLSTIFRILDSKGQFRSIALRATVTARNENGEVTRLAATVIDITRYQHLKRHMMNTASVFGELSYRNSHELRGPVATMLGLATLMRYEKTIGGNIDSLIDSLETTISKMDQAIREFNRTLANESKQIKTISNMDPQIIADNRHYSLAVDQGKNRAYLKIKGYWRNAGDVSQYLADWRKATDLLKRKFTLVTDASEMKTHPQEIRKIHEEAQAILIKAGVARIAEIVQDDIAEIQLNAMARATQLPKKNFKTLDYAEQWLDEKNS